MTGISTLHTCHKVTRDQSVFDPTILLISVPGDHSVFIIIFIFNTDIILLKETKTISF